MLSNIYLDNGIDSIKRIILSYILATGKLGFMKLLKRLFVNNYKEDIREG
ncbi:hypothetical protein J2S17_002464 [Cytobacillus purgationiresistens]|uniref:Uncharacterized protein n=1 Tax=Cytobacillus purgationiresistens TaxID=863449 RepID=A0ABU0AI66_9BACI|nr:hypothetical protein [Cytobacillus purgationiresistens]